MPALKKDRMNIDAGNKERPDEYSMPGIKERPY
jgi:hypothetical protein